MVHLLGITIGTSKRGLSDMNKIVASIIALFIGIFTLVFSIIMLVPLTIFALLTGRKIEKSLRQSTMRFQQASRGSVLEGEYEDLSK